MNWVTSFQSLPWAQAMGWTLVHFIWQGLVIAAALWMVLYLMRHRSSAARYLVSCAGMLIMTAAPLSTMIVVLGSLDRAQEVGAVPWFPESLSSLSFWGNLTPLMPWMTLAWIAGICVLQARLMLLWVRAQHMRSHGVIPAPADAQRMVMELCQRLGVRQGVRLLESSLARIPMVMGWLKPVILVPGCALIQLTPLQLKMVIAHELAHVRRHDYLVNLIQSVFECILFYHPAVWWISNRLRVEREYCCDDVALKVSRDPLCYAKALSSLENLRDEACHTAVASTGGPLMKRIFRIVGVRQNRSCRLGGWLVPLVITLSLAAAVSAVGFAPGNNPEEGVKKSQVMDDEAAFKKKVEIVVQEMKEKGASKEKIKKTIIMMEEEFKASQVDQESKKKQEEKRKILKKKMQMVATRMKEEGATDEEIKKTLMAMEMKHGGDLIGIGAGSGKKVKIVNGEDPDQLFKKKMEAMIKKMKKAGYSDKEIKKAYLEQEAAYKKKGAGVTSSNQATDNFKKKLQMKIEQMKEDGRSKEEIMKVVDEMKKKFEHAQLEKEKTKGE